MPPEPPDARPDVFHMPMPSAFDLENGFTYG